MYKALARVRSLSFLALFALLIAGCGLQTQEKLNTDDLHFASFYADYLARSGVTAKGDTPPLADLTSSGLDTLFVRHKLDQKTFDARLQAYSRDPELWRKVLQEVRRNLASQKQ
ncbi:MAG: DUF4296 domain-containing protein [Chlorobaculum sp.]|nr:DUF4296 domain-containing protein [Chlorobaculum sp.]